jgi:hypothetical protein
MQIKIPKGAALARVQAVSPGFRASLVQPSAALRPFRFAARVGDPPRLDSLLPRTSPVRQGLQGATQNPFLERNKLL